MVREFDASPRNQVTVLFDAVTSFGAGKETTLEYSIKLAASIAQACFQQGVSFRMTPPGPAVAFPHWQAVLTYLARLRPTEVHGAGALQGLHGRVVAILAAADPTAPGLLARIPTGRLAAVIALQGFRPDL